MSLVGQPFDATFTFARSIPVQRRNASGALQTLAPDVPAFDHDALGARIGLLIQGGAGRGQQDRVAVIPGDWQVDGGATVLWAYDLGDGVERRAFYTLDARRTVDALMLIAGHHRQLGVLPGLLPNLARPDEVGFVKYAANFYRLGARLGDGDGSLLADDAGRIIIESA